MGASDVGLDMQWTGTGPNNAAAATCKNVDHVKKNSNPTAKSDLIYDPVIHQDSATPKILDSEHQVTEHQ